MDIFYSLLCCLRCLCFVLIIPCARGLERERERANGCWLVLCMCSFRVNRFLFRIVLEYLTVKDRLSRSSTEVQPELYRVVLEVWLNFLKVTSHRGILVGSSNYIFSLSTRNRMKSLLPTFTYLIVSKENLHKNREFIDCFSRRQMF